MFGLMAAQQLTYLLRTETNRYIGELKHERWTMLHKKRNERLDVVSKHSKILKMEIYVRNGVCREVQGREMGRRRRLIFSLRLSPLTART